MSRLSMILAACGGCASLAQAQVIDWAAAASGNWSNALNWSPMDVPNTAGETARFQVNGTYTATVDGTFSIASLQQTISNVTISIPGGANLRINGPTYNNRGLVVINPANAGVETRLQFDADTNITGNGVTSILGLANRAIIDSLGAITVTNGPNHTFDGFGQFRSVLTNNGTVNANVSGQNLSLMSNHKTNNALFLASGGGVLSVDSITITQGAGGVIRNNGGTLNFTGSSGVTGGTVEGVSPSVANVSNSFSTWTSVTAEGLVNIQGGANIALLGSGLVNNGVLTINPTNAGAETRLRADVPCSITGTGEVVLNGLANRAILDSVDAASVITVGPSQTVRGQGQIRAPFINSGLISADNASSSLNLLTHPKVNNATMQALGAGDLDIGTSVTQGGSGLILADAGTVDFSSGSSLTGGRLNTANAGLARIVSGIIPFSGVENDGMLDILAGTGIAATNLLRNDGLITINPTNAGAETRLRFDDSSSLTGSGIVALSGLENRAILETGAGAVMTVGPNQRVEGQGQVRADLINNGSIVADVTLERLRLQSNNKVNNALMRAENNARLTLTSIGITQGPLGVIEADNAAVEMESSSVSGGAVRTLGAGTFATTSGLNTLRGVTFSGNGFVNAGTGILVTGTGLVNNGLITINAPDAGVETRIRFDESGSLSGTGEVRLTAFNNRAILETNPGITLTNSAPHLISGRGDIRANLINNSTIRANLPTSDLRLVSQPKTNNGLIEVNGGGMVIDNITITQSSGGVIRNTLGNLNISSSTISGGRVASTLPSFVNYSAFCTNAGARFEGEHRVNAGATLAATTGFTNEALLVINPTNAGLETRLRIDNPLLIQGIGEIRLAGSVNRAILDCIATLTLGPAQRLTGIGQIRGSMNVLGTLAPGFSAGTIDAPGATITLTDPAKLEIEVGGTSIAQFDRFTGTGTGSWSLNGTLLVSHIDGFVPALGQRYVIIQTAVINGAFDTFIAPDLGGIEWKVVYFSNKVELQVRCKADLSGSSDPNDPNYGIPDGVIDASDFFYYLDLFVNSDLRADLTTSSDPNDPSYGIKDGVLDASDFFFFLDLFAGVCG